MKKNVSQRSERRDRWDLTKIKPPLFGRAEITFYDVAESRDWRQAIADRRKLNEPIEMRPIPPEQSNRPPNLQLPGAPAQNKLPFVKRDSDKHAAEVAERARLRAAERAAREQNQTRKSGRKRRPRPR